MPKKPAKSAYPPVFDAFPSYKGGHTLQYNGYIWEFLPGHHLQNLWGFVPQHRLIAEDVIGRKLVKGEDVHHKDHVRTNNHPGNLEVMPRRAHRSLHARIMGEATKIPLTEKQVAEALRKHGGIKPAARSLGVSHSTIRNRFRSLCLPYQRVSPVKIDNPRDLDIIVELAADPNVSVKEAAKKTRISAMSIHRICARLGIVWNRKPVVKRGVPKKQYRGKPTRRMLELNAFDSESVNTPHHLSPPSEGPTACNPLP
jgi:hypothetical protein